MKSHGLFAYMLFPLYKLLSLFCCLSICTWFTIAAGSWHHRRAPPPESVAMGEQQRALASLSSCFSVCWQCPHCQAMQKPHLGAWEVQPAGSSPPVTQRKCKENMRNNLREIWVKTDPIHPTSPFLCWSKNNAEDHFFFEGSVSEQFLI